MSLSKVVPGFEVLEFPGIGTQMVRGRDFTDQLIADILDNPDIAVDALQSMGYRITPPTNEES